MAENKKGNEEECFLSLPCKLQVIMVGLRRVELLTSPLSGVRSNHS